MFDSDFDHFSSSILPTTFLHTHTLSVTHTHPHKHSHTLSLIDFYFQFVFDLILTVCKKCLKWVSYFLVFKHLLFCNKFEKQENTKKTNKKNNIRPARMSSLPLRIAPTLHFSPDRGARGMGFREEAGLAALKFDRPRPKLVDFLGSRR